MAAQLSPEMEVANSRKIKAESDMDHVEVKREFIEKLLRFLRSFQEKKAELIPRSLYRIKKRVRGLSGTEILTDTCIPEIKWHNFELVSMKGF